MLLLSIQWFIWWKWGVLPMVFREKRSQPIQFIPKAYTISYETCCNIAPNTGKMGSTEYYPSGMESTSSRKDVGVKRSKCRQPAQRLTYSGGTPGTWSRGSEGGFSSVCDRGPGLGFSFVCGCGLDFNEGLAFLVV